VMVGTWAGLVVGLGCPLCGYVTVRFSERVKRLGGAMAGYLAARDTNLSSVRADRQEVVTLGRRLLESPLSVAPASPPR